MRRGGFAGRGMRSSPLTDNEGNSLQLIRKVLVELANSSEWLLYIVILRQNCLGIKKKQKRQWGAENTGYEEGSTTVKKLQIGGDVADSSRFLERAALSCQGSERQGGGGNAGSLLAGVGGSVNSEGRINKPWAKKGQTNGTDAGGQWEKKKLLVTIGRAGGRKSANGMGRGKGGRESPT